MAITSLHLGIGKNMLNSGNSVIMNIGGRDFNPREPTNLFTFNFPTETIEDGAADTNLSTFTPGHEVFCFVGVWQGDASGPNPETAELKMQVKNPSGSVMFSVTSGTQTLFNGDWWVGYGYVGIDYDEINTNGTYTVEQMKGSTVIASQSITFSNVPSINLVSNPGSMWVEGNNIRFVSKINSSQGYPVTIAHDGTNYGSASGKEGSMWIDPSYDGKISYVDASGIIRRTHLANDGTGFNTGGGTELPLTPGSSKAGSMWVSNNVDSNGGSYGYLIFVGNDGKAYRIMNGPV